jgi:hypothetical protein
MYFLIIEGFDENVLCLSLLGFFTSEKICFITMPLHPQMERLVAERVDLLERAESVC